MMVSRPREVKPIMDSDSDEDMLLAAAACLVKKPSKGCRVVVGRGLGYSDAICTVRITPRCKNCSTRTQAIMRIFLRMEHREFGELLSKVEPLIRKESTVLREAIPAGERLAITLRFLASGMYNGHARITIFIST